MNTAIVSNERIGEFIKRELCRLEGISFGLEDDKPEIAKKIRQIIHNIERQQKELVDQLNAKTCKEESTDLG